MIIDNQFKNLIPSLLPEELERLTASIKKEGIRESLIVWDNILIDGYNRYAIAKKLNVEYKTRQMNFKDRNEAMLWIINNQLGRRNISSYDRTRLALKLEELYKSLAKENLKLGGKGSQKSANHKVDTRKELSKIAKVSHDTVAKVKFIEQKATSEQKERLTKQIDSINKVYHEIKKGQNMEKKIERMNEMPKGSFNVILADPPWKYEFSETNERSIEDKYSTMELDKIKKMELPIGNDSILFLWATAPKLKEALEVMDAWGFKYKTNAIWDKEIIGMGYWFRGQHELILIGIKGNVETPLPDTLVSSIIKSKRERHSQKPEIVYDIIEKMFPKGKYLELFARQKRLNWESWGNEIYEYS